MKVVLRFSGPQARGKYSVQNPFSKLSQQSYVLAVLSVLKRLKTHSIKNSITIHSCKGKTKERKQIRDHQVARVLRGGGGVKKGPGESGG